MIRKVFRSLIAPVVAALSIAALIIVGAGCSLLGGSQKPTPSQDQIRSIVKDEISGPTGTAAIQEATSRAEIQPMINQALTSPEMQKALQDALSKVMTGPDAQKQLSDALKKLMATPDVKKAINDAVTSSLMDIIRKGSSGTSGGGGGSSGGGGGGSSGGGGGGG